MYEDKNLCLPCVIHIRQRIDKSIIINVLFVQVHRESVLIAVDVHRMADADNRVILNVGGIRHETCTYL
jgi:hypothetical protein